MSNEHYDIIIIGGGAAGIGAAIAAHKAQAGTILIIEKERELGGILLQCIHDGFGLNQYGKELNGPEYAHFLEKELAALDVSILMNATVTELTSKRAVIVHAADVGILTYHAQAVVLTTGSYERSAGAINLPGERSAGIYTAGQAQYLINKYGSKLGNTAFIVGSGDIGLIMARRLTLTGVNVVGVSEIMPYSSGLNRNIAQCLDDFNIPLYLSHKVLDVRGKPRINEIVLGETGTDGKLIDGSEKTFAVDTLLLAVGLIPLLSLLEPLNVKLKNERQVFVNNFYQSSVSWLFVAGNALHIHDLADEAYAEGEEAGAGVARYLTGELAEKHELDVHAGHAIGFVIPNFIALKPRNSVLKLKFRVRMPLENKFILIKQGTTVIARKFYQFLFPSELIVFELKNDLLVSDEQITIEVQHE